MIQQITDWALPISSFSKSPATKSYNVLHIHIWKTSASKRFSSNLHIFHMYQSSFYEGVIPPIYYLPNNTRGCNIASYQSWKSKKYTVCVINIHFSTMRITSLVLLVISIMAESGQSFWFFLPSGRGFSDCSTFLGCFLSNGRLP